MAHKKYKRKYLNILFIPDDESSPKSVKIRYSFLRAGLILLIFVAVALLVGTFTYGQLLQKAYENISLKQENSQLKEQVQQINTLTSELNNLKAYGRKVRNSISGYVDLTDQVGNVPEISDNEVLSEESRISVLTSMPLKAPVFGFVSQEYKKNLHNGIDIVAPEGTLVSAAGDGIVLYSGWTMDGGNTIIIGHTGGYYTYYKHNLRNLVRTNQKVSQGKPIAYLGNSGEKSYGPHLHFEVWKNGQPVNPQNLILEYR